METKKVKMGWTQAIMDYDLHRNPVPVGKHYWRNNNTVFMFFRDPRMGYQSD